jgi:urease accessory protein
MINSTTGAPWIDGSVHPLIEPSHLLALILLGAVAAALGGRSRWGLPIMFVALLTFGIVLGTEGAVVPMTDTIVLTTGLGMVLLILGKVRLAFAAITTIAGAFALFHGVADGSEMIVLRADVGYLAGYALADVAVLLLGFVLGDWAHRHRAAWVEHLRHGIDRLHGLKLGS